MSEAAALVIADEVSKPAMNELDIARAIASGALSSPQEYENIWLFALRITGTGAAYRHKHDEYVWRDPSLYLNREFVDRCAGLPVIVEHPAGEMLDSKEFASRVVGTISFAYIKGEDVWGIARIYDQDTAKLLKSDQYSTSPAVVFRDPSVNSASEMEGGSKLLIEGKPSLLDHLAICAEGVWDKGGPPRGVDIGVSTMADDTGSNDKILELLQGLKAQGDATHTAVETLAARQDSLDSSIEKKIADAVLTARRQDDGERRPATDKASQTGQDDDKARRDARRARFSRRRSDDDAAKYKARHDEEEKELAEELEKKEGHKREDAARYAADARKDAEEGEEEEERERERERRERDDKAGKSSKDSEREREEEEERERKDKAAKAKAGKDAEEEEEREKKERREDKRGDNIRMDASVRRYIEEEVRARVPAERPPADRAALNEMQARHDVVWCHWGERAPPAMSGETLRDYNIRLLKAQQKHSPEWRDEDLARVPDSMLPKIEKMIFADSIKAAKTPEGLEFGLLRERKRHDVTGRVISEFYGEPLSWMQEFMGTPYRVVKFNTERH